MHSLFFNFASQGRISGSIKEETPALTSLHKSEYKPNGSACAVPLTYTDVALQSTENVA